GGSPVAPASTSMLPESPARPASFAVPLSISPESASEAASENPASTDPASEPASMLPPSKEPESTGPASLGPASVGPASTDPASTGPESEAVTPLSAGPASGATAVKVIEPLTPRLPPVTIAETVAVPGDVGARTVNVTPPVASAGRWMPGVAGSISVSTIEPAEVETVIDAPIAIGFPHASRNTPAVT